MEDNNPIPENQTQPSPISQSSTPLQTIKQKGYFLSIIGVLVILFIILGAAYYFMKVKSSTAIPAQIQTATPTTQASIADETATWRTYENTNLNISFKYPPLWQMMLSKDAGQVFGNLQGHEELVLFQKSYTPQGSSQSRPDYPYFILKYFDNPKNLTIKDFNQQIKPSDAGDPVSIWSERDELIKNTNGIEAYFDKEHYCTAICQTYVWQNSDKIFQLIYYPINPLESPENQDNLTIFSTFKFTQ